MWQHTGLAQGGRTACPPRPVRTLSVGQPAVVTASNRASSAAPTPATSSAGSAPSGRPAPWSRADEDADDDESGGDRDRQPWGRQWGVAAQGSFGVHPAEPGLHGGGEAGPNEQNGGGQPQLRLQPGREGLQGDAAGDPREGRADPGQQRAFVGEAEPGVGIGDHAVDVGRESVGVLVVTRGNSC